MERKHYAIVGFLLSVLALPASEACGTEAVEPFYVYQDAGYEGNKFHPTEYIGDREALSVDPAWKEGVYHGQTCIRIAYQAIGDFGWAGLYWVNPPGSWGTQRGGYDLRFAKKLTFWARGEKGGEHIAVFRYGGIKGVFNDSDIHGIGPLVLTNEWKQYTIDLKNRNLRYISAGFGFALTKAHNRQGCIFYLDKIHYE